MILLLVQVQSSSLMLGSRKFNKHHSRRDKVVSQTKHKFFTLGYYSAFSVNSGKCCSNQIEAIKLLLRRSLKKQVKLWTRLTPYSTVTKKPNETRLGRGKGNTKYWYSVVKPGSAIIELKGNLTTALLSLRKLRYKTNVKLGTKSKLTRWII